MTNSETTNENHDNADSHGGRQRPSYDDVNTPVVILIGVISMVVTFLTIWFVEGIYYQWQNKLVTERNYDVSNPIQADIINGQKAILEGDDEKGIVALDSVVGDIVSRYKNDHGSGADTDQDHSDEEHNDSEAGH